MTGMPAGGDGVERGAWSSPIQFFITAIGWSVGLGNVWRFPNVVYSNGGGAFLIAYVLAMACLAIPILLMEAAVGQYTKKGPIAIWDMTPLFRGIGFATFIYSIINTIYYNTPLSWAGYYFVNSMAAALPWADCDPAWATNSCTTSNVTSNITTSPENEYFYLNVLKLSGDAEVMGEFAWEVYLSNCILWLVIFGGVSLGAQSLGKVAYFTSLFPYFMLTAMVAYTATLPGAAGGVEYYLIPDISKLGDIKLWRAAVAQVFYSTGCGSGGVILLASFNDFSHNIFRDAILLPFMDCFSSIYAGFAVFMVLGHMAHYRNVPIEDVVDGGPGLFFVTYAELFTIIDGGNVWAVFFFFMVVILGLSSQFPNIELYSSAMGDAFPFFRKTRIHNLALRFGIVLALLSVTTVFYFGNGYYWYTLTDERIAGIPLMIIGLFEVIAVGWFYSGPMHWLKKGQISRPPLMLNIMDMVGLSWGTTAQLIFDIFAGYLMISLCIIAPCALTFILIYDVITIEPMSVNLLNIQYDYPEWASGMAWGIIAIMPATIFIWGILVLIVKYRGDFCRTITPKSHWWDTAKEELGARGLKPLHTNSQETEIEIKEPISAAPVAAPPYPYAAHAQPNITNNPVYYKSPDQITAV